MSKHESRNPLFLFAIRLLFSLRTYSFRDYLKGFHKRKLERRERAQKELEDEIKYDLKNLRQKVTARFGLFLYQS